MVLCSSRETLSLKLILKNCRATRLLYRIEGAYSHAALTPPNLNGRTIPLTNQFINILYIILCADYGGIFPCHLLLDSPEQQVTYNS
jgi:hypothetical protein